jgi:glycosyltransferase involved in cell wall biosynthesis
MSGRVLHETNTYRGTREAPDTTRLVNSALETFNREYPDVKLQPLAVVIAAYNEAENIGSVLDEIPDEIDDVAVSLLVMDDGSADRTAEIARQHGALLCRLSANRGQGVALRLGYLIACGHGARYIATLDADGQWDPADLPEMMRLVKAGRADVVVGSRETSRMRGTKESRNERVRLFAWVTSKLTGTRLTDASSGLRLMRAEVAAAVPHTQPQYHSLEFLIGALFQGFRVAEVPTTMRHRISGTSRKGGVFVRMLRYTQVIARTWWRERGAAPPVSPKS